MHSKIFWTISVQNFHVGTAQRYYLLIIQRIMYSERMNNLLSFNANIVGQIKMVRTKGFKACNFNLNVLFDLFYLEFNKNITQFFYELTLLFILFHFTIILGIHLLFGISCLEYVCFERNISKICLLFRHVHRLKRYIVWNWLPWCYLLARNCWRLY